MTPQQHHKKNQNPRCREKIDRAHHRSWWDFAESEWRRNPSTTQQRHYHQTNRLGLNLRKTYPTARQCSSSRSGIDHHPIAIEPGSAHANPAGLRRLHRKSTNAAFLRKLFPFPSWLMWFVPCSTFGELLCCTVLEESSQGIYSTVPYHLQRPASNLVSCRVQIARYRTVMLRGFFFFPLSRSFFSWHIRACVYCMYSYATVRYSAQCASCIESLRVQVCTWRMMRDVFLFSFSFFSLFMTHINIVCMYCTVHTAAQRDFVQCSFLDCRLHTLQWYYYIARFSFSFSLFSFFFFLSFSRDEIMIICIYIQLLCSKEEDGKKENKKNFSSSHLRYESFAWELLVISYTLFWSFLLLIFLWRRMRKGSGGEGRLRRRRRRRRRRSSWNEMGWIYLDLGLGLSLSTLFVRFVFLDFLWWRERENEEEERRGG